MRRTNVSRILWYRFRSPTTIHLSSRNPKLMPPCGDAARAAPLFPIWPCTGRGLPCPQHFCYVRWALTPPFHPCPSRGGLSLWHFPSCGFAPQYPAFQLGFPLCGVRTFLPLRSSRPSSNATNNVIPLLFPRHTLPQKNFRKIFLQR